jgi:uroporphyrinogen III methyltransferase/synthase
LNIKSPSPLRGFLQLHALARAPLRSPLATLYSPLRGFGLDRSSVPPLRSLSENGTQMKPLQNKKILIACSAKKMVELISGLEAMGGTILSLPVLAIQELEDKRTLDEALEFLERYSWIIFTSAYGVTFFAQRLNERGRAVPKSGPKICAVGPPTARAAEECGFEVALVPRKFVAEGIIDALESYYGELNRLSGERILLPRALQARDVLPKALAAAGAEVDVVPCYRTVQGDIDPDAIRALQQFVPDLMVFTSSSAVRNFVEIAGQDVALRMMREAAVSVIGPITANTVESYGKQPDLVPRENTIASLIEAIRDWASGKVGSG